jgi:hypothetical protein
MKLFFSKSIGRFRVEWLRLLAGLILGPLAAMGTDSIYINTGAINNSNLPQVDATNFYNSGTWNISTSAPYETANTVNYTNEGTMSGSVGWEFDFGTSSASRSLSASFFNDSPGTIQAMDGVIGNPPTYATFFASYLSVQATNIINKGTLMAGASGQIVLTGTNVTLSRSDLEITPVQGFGSINGTTNFSSDAAVYSLFWATNTVSLTSSNLWNGTNVGAVSFLVSGNAFTIPSDSNITNVFNFNSLCGASNVPVQLVPFIPAPGSDSTNIVASFNTTNIVYTNSSQQMVTTNVPTLIVRQAVFLNITNLNIAGQVRFFPSSIPTNAAQTVAVRLSMTSTNLITQLPQTTSIYLVDTLASETNSGLNISTTLFDPFFQCTGPVFRPANYNVSRTDSGGFFAGGSPGSGLPTNNFLYDPAFSNNVVRVNYAACAAFIDNLTSDQQSGGAVTNLGGRIVIKADNLDLSRAALSAQGYINVQANNLVSSANAVVDSPNLFYNLGATNGMLNFTNLANLSVARLQGNVAAWSGLWTNAINIVIPNFDTNSPPDYLPITNVTLVEVYVMVVDASSLSSQVSVTVQNLILHSTNIIVSDSMNVDQTLLLDGQSFTLLGRINLFGSIQNWVASIAPSLRYFTNDGTLFIPNNAHFGDDTATNYAAFVNRGLISAGSQTINSTDLEIYGTNQTTVGDFTATMQTGKLVNALISSGAGIQLFANTLQVNQSSLIASGALNLSVSNSLTDNGAANLFSVNNGFNLLVKPATGDLLGTTFLTTAPARAVVTHNWAGQDLGPTLAGFSNNAAIGSLVLAAGGSGSFQEPEFIFSGTGASNGLYVAYLDISRITNFQYGFLDGSLVSISPNLTIYFGGSSTNPAALNGQFGGHLIYVPGLAGQNTKLSGGSYNSNNQTFKLSITSQPGQTNVIQWSTNLVNWFPIYTNIGSFTFTNSVPGIPYRFYRGRIGP